MTAAGYLYAIQPPRMEVLLNGEKARLAEEIDTWMLSVLSNGGGEQLLEGMHTQYARCLQPER